MDSLRLFQKKKYILILALLIVWLVIACAGMEPYVEYQSPVGSLTVKLDNNGKVKFSVSPGFSIPTPIGSFGAGVEFTPQDFFETGQVLIIEHDGRIDVYDLNGQKFSVNFVEGYYKEISLDVQDDYIKLVVASGETVTGANDSKDNEENANSFESSASQNNNCGNASKIRVAVGEKAEVQTLEHLLLRAEPDADAEVYYRLRDGQEVTILAGPVCDHTKDWNYWKVRLENNMVGWVAEGGDDRLDYFLIPIN